MENKGIDALGMDALEKVAGGANASFEGTLTEYELSRCQKGLKEFRQITGDDFDMDLATRFISQMVRQKGYDSEIEKFVREELKR